MKLLFSLAILCCSTSLIAKEVQPKSYSITKVVKSKYVTAKQAKIKFTAFKISSTTRLSREMVYSIDGKTDTVLLRSDDSFFITTTKGKHIFQFYSKGFNELFTDSIYFKGGYQTNISLKFNDEIEVQQAEDIPAVLKPVLYLYSTTDLAFDVQLIPKGNFSYTYPTYEKGWKGTVDAKGGMIINKQHYPYLFWEANDNGITTLVDYNQGFVVEKENVTAFLEEKLTEMGLNDQERTDFITFWGPRMVGSEKNHVQFIFNEEYDDIATLSITPKPDHLFRLYMLWTPLPETTTLKPTPQKLSTIQRDGFSVVEWGGSELMYNETLANHE